MNRAELEITAPINRDELLGLLNTMTPADEQRITTRARIADVEAELVEAAQARAARKVAKAAKRAARKAAKKAARTAAKTAAKTETQPEAIQAAITATPLFNDVDWDELLTATVSAMVTPTTPKPVPPPIPKSTNESSHANRKCAAPFSHVAALLPRCEPTRFPRATRPPPLVGAGTQRTLPDQKAAQTVADVRARLDSAEETAAERAASHERGSLPPLSSKVVSHLSAEEIAMLPMEIRLSLAEVPSWKTPPRIEMTPVPGHIEMRPVPGRVARRPVPRRIEMRPELGHVVEIHSAPCKAHGHSIRVTPQRAANSLRVPTIIAGFVATFLVGLCSVYFFRVIAF